MNEESRVAKTARKSTSHNAPRAPEAIVVRPAPEGIAVRPAPEVVVVGSAPEVTAVRSPPEVIVARPAPEMIAVRSAPEVTAVRSPPKVVVVRPAPEAIAVAPVPKVTTVGSAPKATAVGSAPEVVVVGPGPKAVAMRPVPHRREPPGWAIQCDFDGTISALDVTDSLLQRFGRDGWQALELAWQRGEIGSRECMTKQVALLDMDEAELLAHLDRMAIDPHFARFVAAAESLGISVQVVSDGLDRAIGHILGRHHLQALPVYANQLLQVGNRRWTLHSPHADAACARASGNCKCALAAGQQSASCRLLYIGDGSSDFCVSGRADSVLAKASLIEHCRAHGIAHHPFRDFADALDAMRTIVSAVPSAVVVAAPGTGAAGSQVDGARLIAAEAAAP